MEVRWKSGFAVCAAVLLLVAIAAGAAAASGGWLVHGVVTDRYGDAVAGATVEVTGYQDGLLGQAVTDKYGVYTFYCPGPEQLARVAVRYHGHVEQTGWVTARAGEPVVLNVTMRGVPPSGYGVLYGIITENGQGSGYVSGVVFADNGYYQLVESGRQWSLQLPVGSYQLWGQRNAGGASYFSPRYAVNVTSDSRLYLPLVLDLQHPQPPAAYPEPGGNTIRGHVWQGDGTPMGGASVELLRRERGAESVVSVATSDAEGAFAFSGVKEYNAAATYLVRASFGQGGTARNASSEPFDVYYHDRLGVPHEYLVEVRTDYLRQPLAYDPSGPLGFRGTPGAHIEVEGLDTGYTLPANFTVPPGTYGYRIWLEGYQDRTGTLVFTGDPCLVQADLQPSVGNLTVVVQPAQASISMDGSVLGQGEVRLANVLAGSHRLSFAAAGYRAQDHDLTLAAGADIRFELALEPIPVNVRIEAPAAARVVFDRVPAGQGTVVMPQVMPGLHILRVELEGYHPYERLVVVAPGENASIAVGEMLPLPAFSVEYMGYTWDNFVRGLGEIMAVVLRSVGL